MQATLRAALLALSLTCCVVLDVSAQPPAVTPAQALARLQDGNALFVADPAARPPFTPQQRAELAKGQHPIATVLSCADSRVPPEIVFRQNPGELFVIRTAGDVTDRAVLASVEYGAEHVHIPLIVVLGHELCGAVIAAIETKEPKSLGPNLAYLIEQIKPAFKTMKVPADMAHLREAILANTRQVAADLRRRSAILEHLHRDGKIQIVGAYYELASGKVLFDEK
jgi:carbonic anhydrase